MNAMVGPRGPAKVTDYEWRATLTYLCGTFYVPMWIVVACWYFLERGIAEAMAPTALEAARDYPDAYGFWLRGNSSFFREGVFNRSELNASSAALGHWIPPPGARPNASLHIHPHSTDSLPSSHLVCMLSVISRRMARLLHS